MTPPPKVYRWRHWSLVGTFHRTHCTEAETFWSWSGMPAWCNICRAPHTVPHTDENNSQVKKSDWVIEPQTVPEWQWVFLFVFFSQQIYCISLSCQICLGKSEWDIRDCSTHYVASFVCINTNRWQTDSAVVLILSTNLEQTDLTSQKHIIFLDPWPVM